MAVGQLASGCIPTACSDSDNVMVAIPRSWFAPCQPKATKAQPNLPLFFIGRGSSQPSVAPKAGIRATTHPTRLWTHPSQLAPAGGSCTPRGAGSGGHGHWWRFALGLSLTGTPASVLLPTPWVLDMGMGPSPRQQGSRAAPAGQAPAKLAPAASLGAGAWQTLRCLSVCPGRALCPAGMGLLPFLELNAHPSGVSRLCAGGLRWEMLLCDEVNTLGLGGDFQRPGDHQWSEIDQNKPSRPARKKW